MITKFVGSKKKLQSGDFQTEFYGKSTDTKPLYSDGARNADMFMEIDTMNVKFFDEDNNKWVPDET